MKEFSVILIGAGSRGKGYVSKMMNLPGLYRLVAVADPSDGRRKNIQNTYSLPDEMCFSDWEEILSKPKFADIALIATMEDLHLAPALKAIELGYDILLEKPLAQNSRECVVLANAAAKHGAKVLVCHVLRYTPFFRKIKELIMEGELGQITSINLTEGVGHLHYSHSYIRGNWHCVEDTTPMLLAKCCHDIDIIQWLIDKPCKKVQSFGSKRFFIPENAPEGAPVRCADGTCPQKDTCVYNCMKIYYDPEKRGRRSACTQGKSKAYFPTDEEVLEALKTNDYGLCVYHANQNVVDHQTVNMEFAGGETACLTMNPFNKGGRHIRIYGTKGELCANMADTEISLYRLDTCETETFTVQKTNEHIEGGHGGGDQGMIRELYEYLNKDYNGYCAADIDVSVKNHLIGYAAELSRHTGTVVDLDHYFKEHGMENVY